MWGWGIKKEGIYNLMKNNIPSQAISRGHQPQQTSMLEHCVSCMCQERKNRKFKKFAVVVFDMHLYQINFRHHKILQQPTSYNILFYFSALIHIGLGYHKKLKMLVLCRDWSQLKEQKQKSSPSIRGRFAIFIYDTL